MAGLTTTGLTIETIESLLASMVADQLANISPTLNTEADSAIGQLNAIYAAALLELWELFEDIYQSGYPDTASGQSLSYLAALTGTIRTVATRGTVEARFFGADLTVIPALTEFYYTGRPSTARFRTIAASAVTGSSVDVNCEAVTPGSEAYLINATEGENLTMPNIPNGLTNVETVAFDDSVLGADEENDSELRIRRELELARPGASTVEAIRTDILDTTGVDVAQVYENTGDVTDANGLPAKSIEVLVFSDTAPTYTAQAVGDTIWASKPAGTRSYGSISQAVTDAAGDSHTVYYSEPVEITTHMLITLDYDSTAGVYIGDTAVKTAIVEWAGLNLSMGDDVIASDLVALVSELGGVVSVDGSETGADSSTVASGNPSLTITLRQLAAVVVGDIDVTSTAV